MNKIASRTGQIILLYLAVVIGVILGSIGRAMHPDWTIWENRTFCQGIGILSDTMLNSILTPLFWLAITAITGLSVIGTAGTPFVLILRGAALGAVLEHLYVSEGIHGFWKVIFFVMPYAFSATLVMLFGAREALRFSLQIAGLLCEKTSEDEISVGLYAVRFVVLFGFMILLSLLQFFLLKYGYAVFS